MSGENIVSAIMAELGINFNPAITQANAMIKKIQELNAEILKSQKTAASGMTLGGNVSTITQSADDIQKLAYAERSRAQAALNDARAVQTANAPLLQQSKQAINLANEELILTKAKGQYLKDAAMAGRTRAATEVINAKQQIEVAREQSIIEKTKGQYLKDSAAAMLTNAKSATESARETLVSAQASKTEAQALSEVEKRTLMLAQAKKAEAQAALAAAKAEQVASGEVTKHAAAHKGLYDSIFRTNTLIHHANWIISGAALFGTLETAKEGLIDVEKGMKGLQTVLPELAHNQDAYNEAQQESLQIMKDYGASVEEVFAASRSFARMYKDQNLVMQLVDNATKLQIVDNMKLEESVRANEASLATWGKELKNSNEVLAFSSHLMDAYTNLSHNAFAPASELAAATGRAAAAAKQAGVDMDHFLGLTASALRAIQRPGGEVGNMLKTIFATLSNPKDKVVEALDAVGVKVRDNNGQLKSAYTLILELSQATKNATLSQDELNNAIEQSARGVFQYSKFSALVGQYDEIVKNVALSINSQGLTTQMAAQQLDTIQKKAAQTRAVLVSLWSGTGDNGLRDSIKSLLDNINAFLLGLEKVGPVAINTAAGIGAVLLVSRMLQGIYARLLPIVSAVAVSTGTLGATSTATAAAHGAQAAAANTAAAATSRLAVATGLATAGISIILGVLAAWAVNAGESARAQHELNQKAQDYVPISLQKQQQWRQESEFLQEMAKQHDILKQRMEAGNLTEKELQVAKKDSTAVSEAVKIALGQEAVARLDGAGWTEDAVNQEISVLTEKMRQEREATLNTIKQQSAQTEGVISNANARIEALRQEGAAITGFLAAEKAAMYVGAGSDYNSWGLYSNLAQGAEAVGLDSIAERYRKAAEFNKQAGDERMAQFQKEVENETAWQISGFEKTASAAQGELAKLRGAAVSTIPDLAGIDHATTGGDDGNGDKSKGSSISDYLKENANEATLAMTPYNESISMTDEVISVCR